MKESFLTSESDVSKRLDKLLSEKYTDISRAHFQKVIKDNLVTVDGKIGKSNYKVSTNQTIEFELPEAVEPDIVAENIPLDIIYEDEDIIVINKPKGMVVHPAPGHYTGTMVNALMYHCKGELSGINGVLRPGIVHRIDRNTTGAIVACKNDFAHNSIAAQLAVHSITRKYEAIVYNNITEDSGTVDAPIWRSHTDRKKMSIDRVNGKRAVTHFKVLNRLNGYTHIECQLETGRTHQIRVHMASIHHPVLGDDVYGPSKCPYNLEGQTLHARVLGFVHPRTGKYIEFQADLPDYFEKLLQILDK